jgi:hypothetical protein
VAALTTAEPENVMPRLPSIKDDRLFRTVMALGAELRKQGALGSASEPRVDLIDLAYAAIAAGERQERTDIP